MSEQAEAASEPSKSGALRETIDTIRTVAFWLAVALVIRIVFFQPFTIPSSSMEPTLYEGDYVVVSKYAYGWSRHSMPFSPPLFHGRILGKSPARGDIVVFKRPSDGKMDLIKRVIGLPGDVVQVRGGVVYINGAEVPRTRTQVVREAWRYGVHDVVRFREILPGGKRIVVNDFGTGRHLDDTEEMLVPDGGYFMMGDNRDDSLDSRAPARNPRRPAPAENLIGRAEFIAVSWSQGASLFKPWTWVMNLRPSRFFTSLR
jgi:signal peptidase I